MAVSIDIPIERPDGKFKMSQCRLAGDRTGVKEGMSNPDQSLTLTSVELRWLVRWHRMNPRFVDIATSAGQDQW